MNVSTFKNRKNGLSHSVVMMLTVDSDDMVAFDLKDGDRFDCRADELKNGQPGTMLVIRKSPGGHHRFFCNDSIPGMDSVILSRCPAPDGVPAGIKAMGLKPAMQNGEIRVRLPDPKPQLATPAPEDTARPASKRAHSRPWMDETPAGSPASAGTSLIEDLKTRKADLLTAIERVRAAGHTVNATVDIRIVQEQEI